MISKQIQLLTALVAIAPSVLADCTLSLQFTLTQNPVVGGDNAYTCGATLDYGDGRKDTLDTECSHVAKDHCYNSQLPWRICVTTNWDLSDGYVDYAAEHRDFNEDGCTKDNWATISGQGATTKCTFPC
ncbi:predicted protein [Aspergillus nidulans FGSC A4]|uniref:Uncharacterized protein n=1 Tax=Emericella nidulans (strain FGSC A4 / ATCC 38163 / CBS 112.46 / NRRL 194 / M139) TaxID=227321 RepID=Q5B1X1_EMENI|nr:hypothetical protein [Aspergillus nidulans FGSC A4]EAA62619.1 predicted protein [Aspergillus nidulans FGSC A4]CBF81872.1 TPA: conserved hypothetical protein [Aspergillus nidulans FGSC A4]|eukprot:XP_663063.1 predicted protein [Aspergillus nidulans FGSC A4]